MTSIESVALEVADPAAARRFFTRALRAGTVPAEVTTDRAPVYPRVLDEHQSWQSIRVASVNP
jgi:IS6 family transposase